MSKGEKARQKKFMKLPVAPGGPPLESHLPELPSYTLSALIRFYDRTWASLRSTQAKICPALRALNAL